MSKLFQQIVSVIVQLNLNEHIFKSSRLQMFYEIDVLRNLAKLT